MRILSMLAGLFFVALGVIGSILPVMPGVVFFIIAAIFFARSNPAWEAKIMNHPKIGPPIRAFRERGVIGPKAKFAAVSSMAVSSMATGYFLKDHWGIWAYTPAAICGLCAIFILTRPSE